MMPTVAMPRMPMPTMMTTTIRITFRALPPPVGTGAGAGTGAVGATAGVSAPGAMAAPHLLQNFVPGFRVAPHVLQNAICHLMSTGEESTARVYRRLASNGGNQGPCGLLPCG